MKYKFQILYVVYILLFALFINARQYRVKPLSPESIKTRMDSTAIILNFVKQNGYEDCESLISEGQTDFLTFMRDSLNSFKIPKNKTLIILDSHELRARFMAYFFFLKFHVKPKIFVCSTNEK